MSCYLCTQNNSYMGYSKPGNVYNCTRASYGQKSTTGKNNSSAISDRFSAIASQNADNDQLADRLRMLEEKPKNEPTKGQKLTFKSTLHDKQKGYLDLSKSREKYKEDVSAKPVSYNFKEVETKIQRAKTSVSAGQAVISAKRKIQEVRRKIAGGKEDPQELQLALTHAKRMEIVAKKKKHHLELEEMVEHTGGREEDQESAAPAMMDIMIEEADEKLTEGMDAIFEERSDMLDETIEMNGENMSDEMLASLNEMISEFGEEELEALEDAMEMFSELEVVDPHMSEEDLKELKMKHRSKENKEIAKADLDYLKELIKYRMQKPATTAMSGMTSFAGGGDLGSYFSGASSCEGAVFDVTV